MNCYEQAIRETATEKSPWYVIPADNKWFMRTAVCDIILNRLQELNLKFPETSETEKAELQEALKILNNT